MLVKNIKKISEGLDQWKMALQGKSIVSIKGMLKGIKVSDADIKNAKKSLLKYDLRN